MEIQVLKWKLKIQFSVFNFLNWDLDKKCQLSAFQIIYETVWEEETDAVFSQKK